MSKIKDLPYNQGSDAAKEGKRTSDNPYWENFDKGMEWAFYAWLEGWDSYHFKCKQVQKELDGQAI